MSEPDSKPLAVFVETAVPGMRRTFSLSNNQLLVETKHANGAKGTVPIPLSSARPEFGTLNSHHRLYRDSRAIAVFGAVVTAFSALMTAISGLPAFIISTIVGALLFLAGLVVWIKTRHRLEIVQFYGTGTTVAFDIVRNRGDQSEFEAFLKLLVERIRIAQETRVHSGAQT